MHGDAEVGDDPAQQRPARLVQLLGHQPGRHLDDVRVQAERPKRIGGLEAEQPATDHHAHRRLAGAPRAFGVVADRVEVVEGPIGVAGRQVAAGHRGHERIGARREHKRVVVDAFTVGGDHDLFGAVDLGDPGVEAKLDQVVARVVVTRKREPGPVPVLGVSGQTDAVVGGVGLLGQHRDPPRPGGVAGTHRLDETMSDHAVADDDHVSGRGEIWRHDARLSSRHCRDVAPCDTPITVFSPACRCRCEPGPGAISGW